MEKINQKELSKTPALESLSEEGLKYFERTGKINPCNLVDAEPGNILPYAPEANKDSAFGIIESKLHIVL